MSKKIFNVLIVGCGNIAGLLDMNRDDYSLPLTHAGAFSKNPRFKITGCIDPDPNRLDDFAKFWNIPNKFYCFKDINRSKNNFDVISICSPTQFHYKHIESSLELAPSMIFCEKPITLSYKDYKNIEKLSREHNVILGANFTRRWDEDIYNLKNEIINQSKGSLKTIIASYNKGILNNGSHIIDLCNYLLGDVSLENVGFANYDYNESDPSVHVTLRSESSTPIIMIPAVSAKDFTLFEIQFIFEKGIITMLEGGLKWSSRKVVDSSVFAKYKTLGIESIYDGSYMKSMTNAVENIAGVLLNNDKFSSTITTARHAHLLCENILNKIKQN